MQRYTYILVSTALATTIGAVLVWQNVLAHTSGKLTVAFLDVGQGDSIYIESPTGTQVLVDSGATRAVLRQLTKAMPLFDTSLDMIVATHPDADHVGGFPDVLAKYAVGKVVYQHVDGVKAGPADAFEQALVRERLVKNIPTEEFIVEPHRGDVWDIGGGTYIVIHYPVREGSASDTNAGSVVMRVVYGDTSFLLTGDSPKEVEEYLVDRAGVYEAGSQKGKSRLQSDVLKLGHHGSNTSTSDIFLAAVKPSYAVISRGCDNTYGHPHKDVLDSLGNFKIAALDTCTDGTVLFESDGKEVKRKEKTARRRFFL